MRQLGSSPAMIKHDKNYFGVLAIENHLISLNWFSAFPFLFLACVLVDGETAFSIGIGSKQLFGKIINRVSQFYQFQPVIRPFYVK